MCACKPNVRTPNCGSMACIAAAHRNGAAAAFGLMGMAEAIRTRPRLEIALCDACSPRFSLVRTGVICRRNCDVCGGNGGVRGTLPLGDAYSGTYEYRCRHAWERERSRVVPAGGPPYLDYCPLHPSGHVECCGCPPWPATERRSEDRGPT